MCHCLKAYILQKTKHFVTNIWGISCYFLSLKSVEGLNFEAAKYRITELIGREAQRFDFLLESDNLSDDEKLQYKAITGMQNGKFSMDEDILGSSIQILSYFWNGVKDQ